MFLIQNNQELETNLEQLKNANALNLQVLTHKLAEQKVNRDRLQAQLKQSKKTGMAGEDTDSSLKLHATNSSAK